MTGDDLTIEHEVVYRDDRELCIVRIEGFIDEGGPGYDRLEKELWKLLKADHVHMELDLSKQYGGRYALFMGLLVRAFRYTVSHDGNLVIVGANDKLKNLLAIHAYDCIMQIEGLPAPDSDNVAQKRADREQRRQEESRQEAGPDAL